MRPGLGGGFWSEVDYGRHFVGAITASVVRAGARGRYFNTVDLPNRLEEESRLGKAGALAASSPASTSSCSTNSATCRSLAQVVSCCSTSSASSTSALR